MKRYKTGIFFLLFFTIIAVSNAQSFSAKNYPKNYFRWPLNNTPAIAANFGELRPNHYHMGLDCKTDKKQNLPVVAAATGYIAKVKIEPYGFGRAIYINHPNGLTTLYAHLNDFYPELEKYVTEQQYKLESWKVFLDIPENLFRVTKGQLIAYSGNTGGSQGPHLHFEIRDTKTDKVLNPLLFDLPIKDNIAPDLLRLAVYDRRLSTHEQSPKLYKLKKINGIYTTIPPLLIINTNKLSFAITAFDKYTGSTNQNGIYEAIVYENEKPMAGFQLDSIGYDETRYLNAHIDYTLKHNGGPYVQHVSKLPGYNNSVYKEFNSDGVVALEDEDIHHIKIIVKDTRNNTSILKFDVQKQTNYTPPVFDNVFNKTEFYSGFVNVFENDNINFYMPEDALYDSIRFRYSEIKSAAGSTVYQLHTPAIPVHSYFSIRIKNNNISYSDKIVIHRFADGKNDYTKADFDNGWYKAAFREFGNFELMIDSISPSIIPVGFKNGMNVAKLNRLSFIITDNTEELKNFTAMLDGKWLRFSNDKGKTFTYKFNQQCPPGDHELIISVEDCVGNKTEKAYQFIR